MNVMLDILQRVEPQPKLAPRESPDFENDVLFEEAEWFRVEEELDQLQPHSLEQYCECCRQLAKFQRHRPAFLGYAILPKGPLGVCHKEPASHQRKVQKPD